MRELETDPPALGFGTQDPRPTVGAVGSGERQSGTGGLGEWPGGLDSPNVPNKTASAKGKIIDWRHLILTF